MGTTGGEIEQCECSSFLETKAVQLESIWQMSSPGRLAQMHNQGQLTVSDGSLHKYQGLEDSSGRIKITESNGNEGNSDWHWLTQLNKIAFMEMSKNMNLIHQGSCCLC